MKREEIEDKEEDKEEDKDQLSQKIKFLQDVLVDYNLQLKLIPESNKSNLFHCVSQALYFSTIYHSHFAQLCIKTLDELLSSNCNVGRKLRFFENNHQNVQAYYKNQYKEDFEKINLELISRYLQTKIIIYHISHDNYLNSFIVDCNYDKTLELIKINKNFFSIVYSKKKMKVIKDCEEIIFEVIDKICDFEKYQKENTDDQLKTKQKKQTDFYNWLLASSKSLMSERNSQQYIFEKKSQSQIFEGKEMDEQTSKGIPKRSKSLVKLEEEGSLNNDSLFDEQGQERDQQLDDEKNIRTSDKTQNEYFKDYQKDINFEQQTTSQDNKKSFPFNQPAYEIEEIDQMNSFEQKINFQNNQQNPTQTRNVMLQQQVQQVKLPYQQVNPKSMEDPRFNFPVKRLLNTTHNSMKDFQPPLFSETISMQPLQQTPQLQQQQLQPPQLQQQQIQPVQLQTQQHQQQPLQKTPLLQQQLLQTPQLQPKLIQPVQLQTPQHQQQQPLLMNNYYQPQPQMQQQIPPSMMQQQCYYQNDLYQNYFKQFQQQVNQMGQSLVQDNQMMRNKIIYPERQTGTLKFFDNYKNYGFIVMDQDGSDIFVHYDDLSQAGISKEYIIKSKTESGTALRFSFLCMNYVGKYNQSRKAVHINLIQDRFLMKQDQ